VSAVAAISSRGSGPMDVSRAETIRSVQRGPQANEMRICDACHAPVSSETDCVCLL
jgi:hypothetical protein